MGMLISFSVENFLPRYVKWSIDFRGWSFNMEMASSCLKRVKSLLFEYKITHMPGWLLIIRPSSEESVNSSYTWPSVHFAS